MYEMMWTKKEIPVSKQEVNDHDSAIWFEKLCLANDFCNLLNRD